MIGLGGQGIGNLVNFLRHNDVEIVAVCDVQKARRDEGARKSPQRKAEMVVLLTVIFGKYSRGQMWMPW